MNTIQFRVIRYIVDKEVYYLGTTIRDSLFTIDVLKDLYWMRWNIETFFKTIKYDLSFDDVHSFSGECIKQEMIWRSVYWKKGLLDIKICMGI